MKPVVGYGLLVLLSCFGVSAQERIASQTVEKASPLYVTENRSSREIRPSAFVPIQSNDAKTLGAGKVLVANRDLGDPNFAETVILLIRYDAQGVVGLVLNRRTDFPLSRLLEGLKGAKERSDPVYAGGPLESPGVFALLQSSTKIEGAEQISRGVYLISRKSLFEQTISARPDPSVFHVYMGYAGWTQDQLRKEVKLGAWFVFLARASTVFSADPDSLWLKLIRETELKLAGNEPPHADHSHYGDLSRPLTSLTFSP